MNRRRLILCGAGIFSFSAGCSRLQSQDDQEIYDGPVMPLVISNTANTSLSLLVRVKRQPGPDPPGETASVEPTTTFKKRITLKPSHSIRFEDGIELLDYAADYIVGANIKDGVKKERRFDNINANKLLKVVVAGRETVQIFQAPGAQDNKN